MQLPEAILLIKKGVVPQISPQIWADLGAGNGLFSDALLSLLPPGSVIHAVDINKRSVCSFDQLNIVNHGYISLN